MGNPNVAQPIAPLDKRCPSTYVEVVGNTHSCKLAAPHAGQHTCICAQAWERHRVPNGGES